METGWLNPGSTASGISGDIAWLNPSFIQTSNDFTSFTTAMNDGETSEYIIGHGFGANIPAGSRITGIGMRVERHGGSGLFIQTNVISLGTNLPTAVVGDNKSAGAYWASTDPDSYEEFGGEGDTWGLVLSASDVNASAFGVAIQAIAVDGALSVTAAVDHMQLNIFYEIAGTGKGGGIAGGGLHKHKTRVVSY